jgi:hypothetical protein
MVRRASLLGFGAMLAASTSDAVDEAPPFNATQELGGVPTYPAIALMRSHGKKLSIGSAIATFAVTVTGDENRRQGRILRALLVSTAVGAGVAYLQEMTEVVASTLLPE